MFKGRYEFVEVSFVTPTQVSTRKLVEKNACDPSCKIGALVYLDNGIDRFLIMGEDAYQIQGSVGATEPKEWDHDSTYLSFNVTKKPGVAQLLAEALNIRER